MFLLRRFCNTACGLVPSVSSLLSSSRPKFLISPSSSIANPPPSFTTLLSVVNVNMYPPGLCREYSNESAFPSSNEPMSTEGVAVLGKTRRMTNQRRRMKARQRQREMNDRRRLAEHATAMVLRDEKRRLRWSTHYGPVTRSLEKEGKS